MQSSVIKPKYSSLLKLFDYFAAVMYGVAASLATGFVIPDAWPMPLAMLLGMALGMLAAVPLLMLFSVILGGFEILMMSMQIGMYAGMAGVMIGSQSIGSLLLIGALVGGGVQFVMHMMDIRLRGELQQKGVAANE